MHASVLIRGNERKWCRWDRAPSSPESVLGCVHALPAAQGNQYRICRALHARRVRVSLQSSTYRAPPPACSLTPPSPQLLQSRTEGGAARRSRLRRCTSRPSTCSALCTLSRASRWARRGDDQLMVLERGAAARLSPRPPPHVCVAAAVRGAVLPHLCATVDGSSRSCGRCLPGAGSTLSSSSLRRRPGVLSDYCVSTAC